MIRTARWVTLGALFIIPFLVLYVSNGLFFPFITGKGFAFRILVEIALAGWVILACGDKRYRPRFSWVLVLYGALVVWMAIADTFAVSPLKAFWSNFERMDGWVTLVHVFAFFVITGSVLTVDKLWRSWWLTFISASFIVCIYGLLQVMGLAAIHQGSVRLDASLGNAAYLAAYLLFSIALTLWLALESKQAWLRYALYALVAFQSVILFFTATRGAILGAIGAVALGALLWMIESGKRGRQGAAIALVALVVIVGGFLAGRHSAFVQNDPTLSRLTSISLSDGATRLTIWHMAWEGFLARPVTGWGQEGFNYIFSTYYEPSMYAQEPWFDRAHNVFLDWLTAGGAPALALFLALLASAVVALYRGTASRGERVMLIGALAAYAFQGLFVFDNLFTYIPLAALLALAHSASARPFKRIEALPVVAPSPLQTIVVPVTAVVALLILWFVNVPNILAASELIQALTPAADPSTNLAYFKEAYAQGSFADQEISEQLVSYAGSLAAQSSIPTDSKAPILTYAVTQMGLEAQDRPKDPRILLEYALAYRAEGDLPDALTQTTRALALAPKKQQILIEEGATEWQLGDLQKAHDAFAQAYALDTAYNDGATYAAAGDIITGDSAGADTILNQQFGTTTVDSDVLVYAYYQVKDYRGIISVLELRNRTNESVDSGFQLASAYALAGRTQDARAMVLATVKQHPEAAATGQQILSQLGSQ